VSGGRAALGRPGATVGVTAASLAARGTLLVLILAGVASLDGPSFDFLVYTLAVTSAAQVFFEPASVASYVVVAWRASSGDAGALWRAGLRWMMAAAPIVAAAPLLATFVAAPGSGSLQVAGSLGALAAAEGVARYSRVAWQVEGRFGRFAGVDLAIAAGRLLTAAALLVDGQGALFALGNVTVATLLGLIPVAIRRGLPRPSGRVTPPHRLIRELWPYVGSTMCSAIYAQAPAVILGVLGGVHSAAIYSVCARLTQPTELIPSAIASVRLPALVSRRDEQMLVFVPQVRLALGSGLLLAVAMASAGPFLLPLFGLGFGEAGPVLILLALGLPLKFVSYQLVALAIARDQIRARLAAAATVAVASAVGVALACPAGPAAVAAVSVFAEALLLTLLLLAARRSPDGLTRPRLSTS
jgi:hypothetical protein